MQDETLDLVELPREISGIALKSLTAPFAMAKRNAKGHIGALALKAPPGGLASQSSQ